MGGAPNMYSEKPPYSENHFLPAAGDENFGIPGDPIAELSVPSNVHFLCQFFDF